MISKTKTSDGESADSSCNEIEWRLGALALTQRRKQSPPYPRARLKLYAIHIYSAEKACDNDKPCVTVFVKV